MRSRWFSAVYQVSVLMIQGTVSAANLSRRRDDCGCRPQAYVYRHWGVRRTSRRQDEPVTATSRSDSMHMGVKSHETTAREADFEFDALDHAQRTDAGDRADRGHADLSAASIDDIDKF